jgi:hypothetical protein
MAFRPTLVAAEGRVVSRRQARVDKLTLWQVPFNRIVADHRGRKHSGDSRVLRLRQKRDVNIRN